MGEAAKMRLERIERLLSELEYEITRGVMEREIEPDFHFRKLFPCAGRGDGMAQMELHVWPATRRDMPGYTRAPKLRLVDAAPTAPKEPTHD